MIFSSSGSQTSSCAYSLRRKHYSSLSESCLNDWDDTRSLTQNPDSWMGMIGEPRLESCEQVYQFSVSDTQLNDGERTAEEIVEMQEEARRQYEFLFSPYFSTAAWDEGRWGP